MKIMPNFDFFDQNLLPMIMQTADSMDGGFFIYKADESEKLIYCNDALVKIFGCEDKDEFLKHINGSFKGIVHPDDYENVERSIHRQIEENTFSLDYVEYRIIRRDGTVGFVSDYGHFAHTEDYGDIFYVFIDDTASRMEKRIEELEQINAKLNSDYSFERQLRKAVLYNAAAVVEVNFSKDVIISAEAKLSGGHGRDLFEHIGVEPIEKVSDFIKYYEIKVPERELAKFREFFNVENIIEERESGKLSKSAALKMISTDGEPKTYDCSLYLEKNETGGDIIGMLVIKYAGRISEDECGEIKPKLGEIQALLELLERNYEDSEKVLEYVRELKYSAKTLSQELSAIIR